MDIAVDTIQNTGGLNAAHVREISGRVSPDRDIRTFHARFGGVKAGSPPSRGWGQAVDYALREGDWEDVEEDPSEPHLRYSAGDADALRRACGAIEASARRRTGPTAERVLLKEIVELPSDTAPGRWEAAADAIVADWSKRGHEAVAALHMHGEERDHPHLHVLVAARPVAGDATVDRSRRQWADKQALRDERGRIAAIVNEVCRPEIEFHPGRFEDIGIDRKPKPRIPQGTFRRARAEMRVARAAGDEELAAEIGRQLYEASAAVRAPLHEVRKARWEKRKPEIEAARARGEWPRPPGRLARAVERAEKAERRAAELEASSSLPPLSGKQRPMLADICGRHGIEGSLDDPAVRDLAWQAYHREQEEREERRRRGAAEAPDEPRREEIADREDGGAVEEQDADSPGPDERAAPRAGEERDPPAVPADGSSPGSAGEAERENAPTPGYIALSPRREAALRRVLDVEREEETAGRRELADRLRPALGDAAGDEVEGLARDVQEGRMAGLLILEASGDLTVLANIVGSDPTDEIMRGLDGLPGAGEAAATAEEEAWASLRNPDEEERHSVRLAYAAIRRREDADAMRGEIVYQLKPLVGNGADAAADALAAAGENRAGAVVRCRRDGSVDVWPGDVDGAASRRALDRLIAARRRARQARAEAYEAAAEGDAMPREPAGEREELRREAGPEVSAADVEARPLSETEEARAKAAGNGSYRDMPEAELRAAFREESLGRANALRDSRDRRAPKEFRDQAARDLADIDRRLAGIRAEARERGVDLEPRRRAGRTGRRGRSG